MRLLTQGAAGEGKAIWVVRGGVMAVQGFDFVGAKVADKNGAGIRFEKGQLSIKDCTFTDNENGILTSSDKDAVLLIENSEFGNNGFGDGYSHNLYVGAIKKLTVTGSYFHHAKVGHLLKSRAAENHIFYNRLTDETGGRANYELEFPNGGLAYVVGNVLADDRPSNGKWLAVKPVDASKPVAVVVKAMNNLLVGTGSLDAGVDAKQAIVDIRNNLNVDWDVFVPGSANGVDLTPKREYVHPRQTRGE